MISIPTPQNTKNTTLVNQTWLWSTHKLCGCILRMHWVSGHISFNLYLLSLISLCAGYNGFELHPEEGTQILNDDKCITGCYGRGGKSPRILNLGPSTHWTEAGWAPEPVCEQLWRKTSLVPVNDTGFRRGVHEIFALLGCYAAYIGSYRRFETYWPHLHGSRNPRKMVSPLKMGMIGRPETSASNNLPRKGDDLTPCPSCYASNPGDPAPKRPLHYVIPCIFPPLRWKFPKSYILKQPILMAFP